MSKYFVRFFTLSMFLTLMFSVFSCKDAPTYEAEITVIDFVSKKVVKDATIKTGILGNIPTKDLHDDIVQSGVTGADGKVKFTFKHKANINFKIEHIKNSVIKTGETNIKLVDNETIKKEVYIY